MNRQLGYPDDARLLIINADDFGMCHAINAATLRALREGIATSTTVMMPCPWAPQALQLLTISPQAREILSEEGIILVGYRALQQLLPNS